MKGERERRVDFGDLKRCLPVVKLKEGYIDKDISAFDLRIRKSARTCALQYTVEPKITGVVVEIIYEKGSLTKAATAEDGHKSDCVTPHIKTILTVPLTLTQMEMQMPVPEFLAAWGVVYVEKQAFADLKQQSMSRGLAAFAYPKEAVMDSLRQTDLRVTAKRHLNLFCTGATPVTRPWMHTQYELMVTLQQWGLRVNRPHIRVCHGVSEVIDYCHQLEAQREDFPYELQGAVITLNALALQAKLREEHKSPEWAMAYLFGASY